MDPNALPFDADAMLDGLRTGSSAKARPSMRPAVNRMMDIASRELVVAGARIERVAGRMGFGDCVRASFPHADAECAGHPGDGASRHGASDRHAGEAAVPPQRQPRLGSRHPGHEGRQLHGAGGDPPAGPRRRGDEVAGHRAADQRRGGGQPIDPRPDRGGGVAPPLRAGAGTGACRWRRGDRPLRHRALQPGGHRPCPAMPARAWPKAARRSARWRASCSKSRT